MTPRAAGIVLVVAALAAACGSDDRRPEAATRQQGSGPAAGEFATEMQRCMAEAGFEVEIMEDGGISSRAAPEQIEVRDAAMTRCADDRGFSGTPSPLTDEQLEALYDRYLDLNRCMVDAGYPTEDPPSRQAFVDGGGQGWHPYDAVPIGNVADFAALESDCPQP